MLSRSEITIGQGASETDKYESFPDGITILMNEPVHDDGKLIRWSAYFTKLNIVLFQLWRPSQLANEFELLFEQEVDSELVGLGAQEVTLASSSWSLNTFSLFHTTNL